MEGLRTERLGADAAGVARAAQLLAAGALVAFPTETVYGLGARADRAEAVRRIFEAKQRPAGNPLIVHVASVEAARALAAAWPDAAERLAAAFWPGPLTLVVRRAAGAVADEVAANGPTVALRAPMHPIARALLQACALPIAAPSANRSTSISPTRAEHVHKTLDGRIDAVLDGGATGFGIESTIVDVTASPARLLRHGAISLAALSAHVAVHDAAALVTPDGARAPSPGTAARHYAPRAELVVVAPGAVAEVAALRRAEGLEVGTLERVGARASTEVGARESKPRPPASLGEMLPDDPAGYAAGLYAALHRLDDAGCDCIVVAAVPEEAGWAAVRDRLRRASAAIG
jgi:L-threonylcarbamoyladenylate synthase